MLTEPKPFTIRHLLALALIRSPFLAGASASFQDLFRAALICADSQYADTTKPFAGDSDRARFEDWIRRCLDLDWFAEIEKMKLHIGSGIEALAVDFQNVKEAA